MEMARGLRAKNGIVKHSGGDGGGGLEDLNSDNLLVIKLPDSRVLRVVSRSLFLAMVVVSLPCIGFIFRGPSASYIEASEFSNEADSIEFESLSLLFQDLVHEGLIREGHRALILSSGIGDPVYNLRFFNILSSGFGDPVYNLGLFNDNEIEIVPESDLEHSGFIPDEKFDIVFASSFRAIKFVDPLIKTGGILALQLSETFKEIPNYRIVYVRRFNSTVVAVRKTVEGNEELNSSTKRGLCAMPSQAKKAALKGLESALLESPRHALKQSRQYLKRTKFLPDLLGDSLEGYPQRIFINVGFKEESSATMDWFHQNYPKRNQDFVIYNLEIDGQPGSLMPQMGKATNVGISGWLMENVKEEEYVVMKAEAEVVEEMIKGRIVCLVDELFLGCNHQRQKGENNKQRAYWECLALYGRLRDEGVAVHQWWG